MAFQPTYQDYLQFGQFGGGDGSGSTPGTEQWWNSLSPEAQFQLIGGNLYIHPGDSRYQGLADATHSTSGSDMVAYGPQNANFGGEFVDPTHVSQQGGATISPWDNHSPAAQHNTNLFPQFLALAGALVGGGLGANALFGFNGGAGLLGGSAGAAGAAGDVTPGMLSNITAPEIGSLNLSGLDSAMQGLGYGASAGAAAGGGDFTLPSTMENITAPPIGAMNTGGLDSAMQGLGLGGNYAPVTDLSTNAAGGGGLSGLLGGGSALQTLLRVAGLGTTLSGLLGGNHNNNTNNNNNNANNTGGGSKGGTGQGLNVTRGAYAPNPITQQQLQNFQYAQPRGR